GEPHHILQTAINSCFPDFPWSFGFHKVFDRYPFSQSHLDHTYAKRDEIISAEKHGKSTFWLSTTLHFSLKKIVVRKCFLLSFFGRLVARPIVFYFAYIF
ncbi:MAG: hypothetical protein ABJA32_00875, partial [Ginsengibacter sp.]